VDIIWGTKGIDKSKVDKFNASDIGQVVWDPEFEFYSPEQQQMVYEFCQQLKKSSSLLYLPESVTCWIDDFRSFVIKDRRTSFPA
jgi:hypothetical protein